MGEDEKCSRPKAFGTRANIRFVVPPKFGTQWSPLASCYGEGAVDVSVPAPPLSFVRDERDTFSDVSLSVDRYPEYCCGIFAVLYIYCMRWNEKSQAMGREEGFTMQRQSRSPRARPRTSISAVAMLLAKGMLFWSHRREI